MSVTDVTGMLMPWSCETGHTFTSPLGFQEHKDPFPCSMPWFVLAHAATPHNTSEKDTGCAHESRCAHTQGKDPPPLTVKSLCSQYGPPHWSNICLVNSCLSCLRNICFIRTAPATPEEHPSRPSNIPHTRGRPLTPRQRLSRQRGSLPPQ